MSRSPLLLSSTNTMCCDRLTKGAKLSYDCELDTHAILGSGSEGALLELNHTVRVVASTDGNGGGCSLWIKVSCPRG